SPPARDGLACEWVCRRGRPCGFLGRFGRVRLRQLSPSCRNDAAAPPAPRAAPPRPDRQFDDLPSVPASLDIYLLSQRLIRSKIGRIRAPGLSCLPSVRVLNARPAGRAFVNDRQPQNLVIPSRNHGNPHPSRLVSGPGSATGPPEGTTRGKRRNSHAAACVPPAQERTLRARGINEAHRHFGPGLLSQGGGLPVGMSGAHPCTRIYPPDRRRALQRRLYDQLGIQRVPRDPWAHLRPPLRTRLPPWPGGETV